mgnify:CR=1 FL=1
MSSKNRNPLRIIIFVLLIILCNSEGVFANNLEKIVNLKGIWKFSIGDNPDWKNPNYNDKDWDNIYVPRSWEGNGYHDYNGFAWYRTEFELLDDITEEIVYLSLGHIDDADEVYLNGHFIGGFGNMPPNVSTAFDTKRRYEIPIKYLNINSTNHIAVRVYDYYNAGGIVTGPIGLYKVTKNPLLEVNLTGFWFFETEKEVDLRLQNQEKQIARKIFVPGYWEDNGYKNYDGEARYTTRFKLPKKLVNQELFLVLGFIDDTETVYLNRKKIGSVSSLKDTEESNLPYHKIFRGYAIPKNLLKNEGYNSISIIIYDKGGAGGIYDGPIGIATKENYEILKQTSAKKKSTWELFLDLFRF